MADLEGAPIPGTDLAEQPFFSPDGDWIAFFAGDRLKKVSVTGGPVSTICVLPPRHGTEEGPDGGDWGRDGTIIFAMPTEGLYRVSANSGVPERIAAPDPKANEVAYVSPQILSDQSRFFIPSVTLGRTNRPASRSWRHRVPTIGHC